MPSVKLGFFPLDEQLQVWGHSYSPATIKQMVRLGVEIPSYRRAADNYTQLTKVGVSKSKLADLVKEYGGHLVVEQEAEAVAMVKPPAKDEVITEREMPQPDSEVMALSMDGALVNIVDEGWKEVKTVAISAVESQINAATGELEPVLSQHSYRAGLWEAKTFACHQWAEGCRRGLERASQIISVNDGAAWIWAIVLMCWAPCVQIIDWWHVVEKLWAAAAVLCDHDPHLTARWMKSQKTHLWHSQLRPILRVIRLACPRGQPLPDPVRAAVSYLFHHRHRMRYQHFRQAGYPIGSGTVESACKLVMQERMKQAGMRWSRDGAQAMLALRSALLSDRWDETWFSLPPYPKPT